MRIRVNIDIQKPLRQSMKLSWTRLSDFGFNFGMRGYQIFILFVENWVICKRIVICVYGGWGRETIRPMVEGY